MKRAALVLLLLAVIFQFSSLAIADPIAYPTEPSQEFPTLKVNSPKNGEVFTETAVEVNFTVTKPDSWNSYWQTTMPVIGTYVVHIYLDGNLYSKYPLVDPGSSGFPTADYSVFLYWLQGGTHSVKIEVEAYSYYDDPSPDAGDYLTYSKNITETINFTVNADLPTPTPSPTSSPSPEPALEVEHFPTALVTGVIVAVAIVGIGLFVYFKKRNNAKINQYSEVEPPSA